MPLERGIAAQKYLRYAVALSLVTIFVLNSGTREDAVFGAISGKNSTENMIFKSRSSGAVVGNTVLSYRPAFLILQNPKLPDWVKNYATWHREQRARFLEAKRNNSSSADDIKFLIYRCLMKETCGGTSDRLQDLPYKMMVANQTNRVLLVRWEKPVQLETFLVPPEDGIDWSMEGELYEILKNVDWNFQGDERNSKLQIVSKIRMKKAAPEFKKYETEVLGYRIYHEIFRLLFTPSQELAERVEATMKSLELIPTQYSSVHLRVKYPRYGIDPHKLFKFQEHRSKVVEWATNAVNCAVELHPNSTIYVSSDNNDTIGYLLEDSPFAQHYMDATKYNKHPLVVKLVARDYSKENAHIAFSKTEDIDEFMSVFEDLIIMGMGKCVAHGLGGYGRLAAALCGGECVVTHRGENSKVCLDALANTTSS